MARIHYEAYIAVGKDGRLGKGGRRFESFDSIQAAERSARALVRWSHGRQVWIKRVTNSTNRRTTDLIAIVCADALGRVWTDAQTMDGLI